MLPDGRCRILHVRLKVATMIPAQINVGASVPLVREWQGLLRYHITGTKSDNQNQSQTRRTRVAPPPHHPPSLTPFSMPFILEFCFPENLLFR